MGVTISSVISVLGDLVLGRRGTVNINGTTYEGNNIRISGGRVIIDGVEQEGKALDHVVNIYVEGDVNSASSVSGNVTVKGNAGSLQTTSGDIECGGDVSGDIKTVSGDVSAHNVAGRVTTVSGDIRKN